MLMQHNIVTWATFWLSVGQSMTKDSTLLTANMIFLCTNNTVVIDDFYLPFNWKKISSFSPPLSYPTSCISIKSNLNIADSLSADYSYLGISSPLTFHVSNLKFPFLARFQRKLREMFLNILSFYGEELLTCRWTPKLEDHSFPAVRDCLFNVIVAILHVRRPSPPSATSGPAIP
jgi:hypothetical protein